MKHALNPLLNFLSILFLMATLASCSIFGGDSKRQTVEDILQNTKVTMIAVTEELGDAVTAGTISPETAQDYLNKIIQARDALKVAESMIQVGKRQDAKAKLLETTRMLILMQQALAKVPPS